jgi:SAM-dependent methyltransferase
MKNSAADFNFKELDAEGLETLKVISEANHFNQWTYETIAPYCRGKILEIGSGIGNISEHFINSGRDITLSDIRKNYREFLDLRFPGLLQQQQILPIDLVHPQFDQEYHHLIGKFDTVFSLNVIEHIEDDYRAVNNCRKLLKPGGCLVLLMPSFPWLYNRFDRELFHFRRYNRKRMRSLFDQNKMKLKNIFYFNAAGIPGWFVSGSVMRNKTIPSRQMRLFNRLVPVFRIFDKLMKPIAGLSIVGVGFKPGKEN